MQNNIYKPSIHISRKRNFRTRYLHFYHIFKIPKLVHIWCYNTDSMRRNGTVYQALKVNEDNGITHLNCDVFDGLTWQTFHLQYELYSTSGCKHFWLWLLFADKILSQKANNCDKNVSKVTYHFTLHSFSKTLVCTFSRMIRE